MNKEKADRAYNMFQNGFDTVEIGQKLRISEGDALFLITEGRKRHRQRQLENEKQN